MKIRKHTSNQFFLFWYISYKSALVHAKLLHHLPIIPLLKQNLQYFYRHQIHCHLCTPFYVLPRFSLFYLQVHLSPQTPFYLHHNSCHGQSNNKALQHCFGICHLSASQHLDIPAVLKHTCTLKDINLQCWESQNVPGGPSLTLWENLHTIKHLHRKTNWK